MKNILSIILLFLLSISCNSNAIKKPENLIEREKMVDIIYDLSILEAAKSQKPIVLEQYKIQSNSYVYKKYSIDSTQFANSVKYYAADLEKYNAIYDSVNKKIERKLKTLSPN
ncbi:MAG: DUF4296 domain-containing protein [Flavobacterium sp.]